MTMAFWSGINIASLIILCLMYWNTGKDGTKIFLDLKLFRYFQVAVLLHLIFDTMGYLLIKEPFAVSLKMAYAVNTLYYITVPIPPFIWFLVCDYKVYNNVEGLKKRLRIYLIPIVIHTVFVMFTPLHGLTFYIDAESIYHRGTLAAFTWIICWLFSFGTYPMLAIKTKNKPALQPKGLDVYYYLFQVAPIVFSVIQVLWHGSLLISLGLVISTFIIFANVHSRRLTEIAVAKGTEKTMRELEMKVAELTATFNAIPDLLCIKDLDFVITECNNALLTHYGIRREDIVGTSTKQGVKDANYTDEEIEMYSTCDQRAVDECIPILNEEPIPRFDGTQPLFETIKAPIIINDKVVGIVAVARDLTKRLELQKAELDKEQAEKRAAQMENEMTKSRIAVMLSQVKPHFLFNALTAISQLCDIDPVRAKRVTIEFSNYLRGNMTSLDEINPIKFDKEIQHVQGFLNLEMAMYGKALNVIYDIQHTDFKLPVLSLQAMVENAVRHGIGKRVGGGTVTISTRQEENENIVVISDNGIGFDYEKAINDGNPHIGIKNIRERLETLCGGTLIIESSIGAGTKVTITIPKFNTKAEAETK